MSGSLIPNAKQQYLDANGNPLAGGFVYYYIPSTTTFKNTYQNAALTILNTNPIILDSAGECMAYGNGSYRQIVTDVNGNLIWDQTTISFLPVDSSNITYTAPFTGSVAETLTAKLSQTISVLDFGADNTGATDSSSAFNNAITALSSGGGTIYIPPGIYALNITINTDGIRFVGSGVTRMSTTPITNYLKPFNTANPVMQIGNDTRLTTGVTLENIMFYGANTGTSGLTLGGGAYRNRFVNISSYNFTTSCLYLNAGSSYPVAYNNFVNLSLSSSVAGVKVLNINESGASYCVANHIANFDISGPSASGYAISHTGSTTLTDLSNGWVQASNNCGVYMTYGTKIYANGFHIDSDNSTDNLITVSSTTDFLVSDYISGNFTVDGRLSYNSGVSVPSNGYGYWFPYHSSLNYPIIYGSIDFNDIYAGYSQMDIAANRVKVYGASTNLVLDSSLTSGNVVVNTASGGALRPSTDNAITLGTSSNRWSTVYAATGTINTSDGNQKEQVAELTVAEKAVAKSIKGLIRTFKFKDSVKEKGSNARIHVGVIAQDVKATFEAQGLDANNYGLFCSDTWINEDGTEQTQLGIRYEELLAFVISAL